MSPVCRGLVALLLAGCGVATTTQGGLAADIDAVIHGPDYKHAHWGILVVDLESGRTIHELNADKLFAPASVTKLYSVAAALDALGADHRFETPVYRRGDDLVLVASGDLTMGGRTDAAGRIAFKNNDHTYAGFFDVSELTEPDPLAGLNELVRQVAASGIKRVGDVVVDDRLFEKAEGTGSGPSRLTPIIVNDNVIDFVVTPGAEAGRPATVTWRPESSAVRVEARVETVAKDVSMVVTVISPSPGLFVVRGQVPAGRKPVVRIHEVEDAATFARTLFIESLQKAGVAVDAPPSGANPSAKLPNRGAYEATHRVALLTSPPFSENVRLILKVSHNLHASTLPLLVAARSSRRALEAGMRLQRDFLKRAGVDADSISFGGGAGGSRADYTTPRATVQLLRHMAGSAVYRDALPILGVDGTLATAVAATSPARGHVRAKTGTLVWYNAMNDRFLLASKALAGYLETARGRTLAIALFVNHTHIARPADSSREGQVLGRLCEILRAAE